MLKLEIVSSYKELFVMINCPCPKLSRSLMMGASPLPWGAESCKRKMRGPRSYPLLDSTSPPPSSANCPTTSRKCWVSARNPYVCTLHILCVVCLLLFRFFVCFLFFYCVFVGLRCNIICFSAAPPPSKHTLTKAMEAVKVNDSRELEQCVVSLGKELLEGADGQKLLELACEQGHTGCVRVLLHGGCSPSPSSREDGMAPTHLAARNGHLE